jgi:pyruvate/2-oxoglutarate dehydrogenase complex dihydrolipoamide dehydrogenase (E3) component
MADEHYDAIVIGTSQGGRFLPLELAKAGHKVALVERDQLGGVCVNTGCTPTKTMVASARLAYQARRGAEYGVRIGPVSVDLAAVRERKRTMVAGARQNYASRLAQDGLDLIEGEAHFTGPKTVEIALTDGGTRQISAPVVVIDAGTRPKPLAITGAGDVPVLDSTSIMELDELPEQPDHPRRRLHRAGARADVPPLRQRGHHHPKRRAPDNDRGRGRLERGRRYLAR